MQSLNREIVIILGKTGYGKSTWLSRYCGGKKRIFAYDPFAKFPTTYLSDEQLLQAVVRGDFEKGKTFSVGSFRLDDLELIGALSFVTGDCLLVIEEAGFIWSKGERIPEWLSEIVFLGRHQEVSLAITAQGAALIPIDLRSQAHRVIAFWQTEKRDTDWLENYFHEMSEDIFTLPKFECLDSEDNNVTRYKVFPVM